MCAALSQQGWRVIINWVRNYNETVFLHECVHDQHGSVQSLLSHIMLNDQPQCSGQNPLNYNHFPLFGPYFYQETKLKSRRWLFKFTTNNHIGCEHYKFT